MKHRISTLLLSACLATGLFGVQAAGPAGALAAPGCGTMSITVYRDVFYAGPHAKFCYGISGVRNLGDLDGPCGFFGDWNDCISSFTADVPTGWCLRLYRNAVFNGLEYAFAGFVHVSAGVMAGGYNDTTSSIRFDTC
jgi:hypothetical protein